MKFLRSPWVTGLLVVAAFVVVFYQVVKPKWGGRISLKRNPAAATPATAPQPKVAVTSSRVEGAPASVALANASTNMQAEEAEAAVTVPIDTKAVRQRYKRWVEAPERDPFILVHPVLTIDDTPVAEGPSPIANWRLKGIWRQTGGRAAAINSGVYEEGDLCEGYRVERIEADQVWIVVSNRLERLRISYGNTTNAPAKTAPRR